MGVWGLLGKHATHLADGADEFGRWASIAVKGDGSNGKGVVIVSCYRAPSSSEGGMVGRLRRELLLPTDAAVHARF